MLCERKGEGVDLLNSPDFLGLAEANSVYVLSAVFSAWYVENRYSGIIFVGRRSVV